MRLPARAVSVVLALMLAGACGGGGGATTPNPPAPTPAPTPTPEPAGTIDFQGGSLPAGSTVEVAPMHGNGQQAPSLRFWATVVLNEDLALGLVQAFVRTDEDRCMGGGEGNLVFPAGVPVFVQPLSMSHQAVPPPPCALPYSTTHVEIVVYNRNTQEEVLSERFEAVYHFVPES